MTSAVATPVRVEARIDTPLSRWLWLVKWLLAVPHFVVLAFLWAGFAVLSVVALVAIVVTGRYPRPVFEFTTGVLRWTWRVAFYTSGAFGTDRYPPFTLGPAPDYPASLDIAYPEHLSRGLALVKWWLLALPHYLVVAVFAGGGTFLAYRAGTWTSTGPAAGTWSFGGGLIGLLALLAAVILLVTGRYPRGLFDLLLGLHRWVLRVVAYAALMTDAYPPFRLDLGGAEPVDGAGLVGAGPTGAGSTGAGSIGAVEMGTPPTAGGPRAPEPPRHWSTGRVVSVVLGSVLLLGAVGTGIAGAVALGADRAGRDATGYITTPTRHLTSSGYALVFDPVDLEAGSPAGLRAVLGDVRVRAAAPVPVFVGIGPTDAVAGYLGSVDRDRMTGMGPGMEPGRVRLTGRAPATPPAAQTFWVASATGPGEREATWSAQPGSWAVVVMNGDGSRPVAVDVSLGATAPGLPALWTGLFVGAAVALLVGAVLVLLPLLPRRHPS